LSVHVIWFERNFINIILFFTIEKTTRIFHLRKLNKAELTKKLEDLKKELLDLRVKKKTSQAVQSISKMFNLIF
jgi:ribosomal protein L29